METNLESNDFGHSRTKTDVSSQEVNGEVRIDTQVIHKSGSFKYLGSIIQGNVMKLHLQKMQVAEMQMLRWMANQDDIRGKVRVATVMDKMQKAMLRWFVHVNNKSTGTPVNRCEKLTVIGLTRCKGRPSKNWRDVITQDITHLQLTEDITLEIR
ncbi:hypothetical protein H5410_038762 [Solanum commersonii]|uniref:Uncharacterized protein n=1 Tax=Solanum commersonii TaxID=4109 RepID=A0A9J5YBJ9_SOLCO|nr:hypothetical protein H5410_038762 [Solanum commersonii]